MGGSPKRSDLRPTSQVAVVRFPPLYAIVDVEVAARFGVSPLAAARAFLAGGARCLQLRAKTLAGGAFLVLAREAVAVAASYQALLIVNDRADVAAMADAHGVHLGQDDLPPAAARRMLGDRAIIGLSTHTGEQLRAAALQPLTYVAVGPVFGSTTKETGYAAVGLGLVGEASRLGLPVVAIGGITRANARSVLHAGAASVAIISDLFTGDSETRTRELVTILGS